MRWFYDFETCGVDQVGGAISVVGFENVFFKEKKLIDVATIPFGLLEVSHAFGTKVTSHQQEKYDKD